MNNVENFIDIGTITVLANSEYRSNLLQIFNKLQKGNIKTTTNLIRTNEFRNLSKSTNNIESEDFKVMLTIHLSDLPPIALINDDSINTLDRAKHWCKVKFEYELLYHSFKAYFSGNANPHENLHPDIKNLIDLTRDDYLALYALLHDGWYFISKKIKNSNNSVLKIFTKPSKTFLEIISREALYRFYLAYPEIMLNGGNNFSSFSPRQSVKQTNIYESLQTKKENKSLTKPETLKLIKLEKEVNKIYLLDWGRHLRDFCVNACNEAPKRSTTYRKLAEYQTIEDELYQTISTLSHNARGSAWRNGVFLKGYKSGGTYSL